MQCVHLSAELLSHELFTNHPDLSSSSLRVSRQILREESTSIRATDIQHPLGWLPFEVNSPIHLTVQLSILQTCFEASHFVELSKKSPCGSKIFKQCFFSFFFFGNKAGPKSIRKNISYICFLFILKTLI